MLIPLNLLSLGSPSTGIYFSNGNRFLVQIRPVSVGDDWAEAYLRPLASDRPEKLVGICWAKSKLAWFRRKDGSVVLLIGGYRAVQAFTITGTGKVYGHTEPWYSDALIAKCTRRGARIIYYVEADSPEALEAGVKPRNGTSHVQIAFDWSPSRMKWVSTVLGYP
ncbi:MAG: hypothetical protein ACR2HJ_05560 [Fimbriimonadales bacterium]